MSKKVLVVDDEPDVRQFICGLLGDNGYQTVQAKSGADALIVAQKELPDLIMLDLQMPDATGTDFFRRLRSKKELRDTPVIVVSGLAGRNLAVARDVPVLSKPIDTDELLKTVEKILEAS